MILVMEVISAEDVPGSKNLRVYNFKTTNSEVTVVANRTNIYEPGDKVAVAQVGSILSAYDNLEIKERKLFGIESSGMALGKVDLDLGTELDDSFSLDG